MARIIVICYNKKLNPGLPTPAKEGIKKMIGEFVAKNPEVKFNGVYCDFMTGIGIMEWEAPRTAPVEAFLKQAGAPYDTVVAVEQLY